MNDSTISVRYARALFASARGKELVAEVRKDMQLLLEMLREKPFRTMLESPVLPESKKTDLVTDLLGGHLRESSLQLLKLTIKNNREVLLADIARHYEKIFKQEHGIQSVMISSPVPINDTARSAIVSSIEKTLETKAEVSSRENSELIGGFVIRVEDQQYDASVKAQLAAIKKKLLK